MEQKNRWALTMSTQPHEEYSAMEDLRERLVSEVEISAGSDLDILDEFLYFATKWQEDFIKVFPLHPDHMFSPRRSREAALAALFAESIRIAVELGILVRSGMVRPAMASLRKLYEAHVDLQFIELDYTGESALRWTHWGVADRAKLRPHDAAALKERDQSKELFQDDRNFGRHGFWAKSVAGKTYTTLLVRARFVDKQNEKRFGYGDQANFANSFREDLIAKTNALVHPNIAGNEEPFSTRIIAFLAAYYIFFSLLAYKNGVDEYLPMPEHNTRGQHLYIYPAENGHLAVLAQNIIDAFDRLAKEVAAPHADEDIL